MLFVIVTVASRCAICSPKYYWMPLVLSLFKGNFQYWKFTLQDLEAVMFVESSNRKPVVTVQT